MQHSNFLELVAKERTRQIVEKGYTREHDDEHTDGSLADAGACYGATSLFLFEPVAVSEIGSRIQSVWKWEPEYFKKEDHDRKQQLIIGAAFFMAEYERIVREEQKDSRCRGCQSLKGIKPDTWCDLMGISMDEYSARCDEYQLPPFKTSEDNPLLTSFNRSSYE